VRTKKPLAVPLAPLVWKLLVGEPVSVDDLEETDTLYAQSLRGIRDIHQSGVTEVTFHEVIKIILSYMTYPALRSCHILYRL
jgi:E3 ubiquitin-protein ligase HERC1